MPAPVFPDYHMATGNVPEFLADEYDESGEDEEVDDAAQVAGEPRYYDKDGNPDLTHPATRRATEPLNLSRRYRPEWGCDEAFRESYQNWRDGILRSANLDLSQFRPYYSESKRLIQITVPHPDTEELLGFITFKKDKDGYCVGGIQMANFNAKIGINDLGTGATTKYRDSRQTGQHGDGMKIAALVFRRENYNYRLESACFNWKFIFKNGKLSCSLSRINDGTLTKLRENAHKQPRTVVAHPWKDVCVIIGAPGKARNGYGSIVKGNRPHVDNFKNWLKVTLDINPPSKIVRTSQGDLIRDPIYQARFYLHGLFLPGGGISGPNYAYGYNFIKGSTTSDRDSLARSGEESTGICAIWAAAIRADDSEDSDMTAEYTNLLLNSLNKKGDVFLSNEVDCLPKDIAERVWKKMLSINKGEQGREPFYYSAHEAKDGVQIIEQSLRRNPVLISTELWKMLDIHHLCRTPTEELLQRFKSAKAVDIPRDNFATHVDRMLRCLLRSSAATKDMELTFVNGEHLNINAGFFATQWKIHNKWLTWEGAHENIYCDELQSEGPGPFSCDHALLQLWDIMISQLIATGEHAGIMADVGWLKSMAQTRLAQMPRSVECSATDKKNQVLVTWKSVDNHQQKDKGVKVVLHEDGCLDNKLVYSNERQCECRCLFSQVVSDGVTFTDLDPDISYYPSVSRDYEGAFVALPPEALKPRWVDVIVPEISAPPIATIEPASPTGRFSAGLSLNNYQPPSFADEDDEDGVVCQIPNNSPSPAPPELDVSEATVDDMSTIGSRSTRISKAPQQSTTLQPREESHVLGVKIEHKSLDWGGSFPGSHDFYRTRDAPDEEVFIVKPKPKANKPSLKRTRFGKESEVTKRARTNKEVRSKPSSTTRRSSPWYDSVAAGAGSVHKGVTRGTSGSLTPQPEGGIRYRY